MHIRNHNTGDIHRMDVGSLARQLRPLKLTGKILGIVLGSFILIGAIISWGVAFAALLGAIVVALGAAIVNSRKAAQSLLDSTALADLDAQLAKGKPIAI